MSGVVRARRGERIVLAEYPAGHLERVNAALNRIAAEDVVVPEVVAGRRRPRGFAFPPALSYSLGIAGVVVLVFLGMRFSPAQIAETPSPTPLVSDVQLVTK